MKVKKQTLTSAELEIMNVIWELGQCNVRDVYKVLLSRKDIAYTTIMTIMNILEHKGHLKRHKERRTYIYRPTHTKTQVISNMVDDFVKRVFDGSARHLVLNLANHRKLSEKDLQEISSLLKDSE